MRAIKEELRGMPLLAFAWYFERHGSAWAFRISTRGFKSRWGLL